MKNKLTLTEEQLKKIGFHGLNGIKKEVWIDIPQSEHTWFNYDRNDFSFYISQYVRENICDTGIYLEIESLDQLYNILSALGVDYKKLD